MTCENSLPAMLTSMAETTNSLVGASEIGVDQVIAEKSPTIWYSSNGVPTNLLPHPSPNTNRDDNMTCKDCNGLEYIEYFDENHDVNMREPCWSCESEKRYQQDLIREVSKIIVNTSPQRLALMLAENIVNNAHMMDRNYSFIQQYVESKQKESLLQYANTVA